MKGLTIKQLGDIAGSVVATRPHSCVSDKYTFVPTTQVVNDLLEAGWQAVKVNEARVLKPQNRGYQKHMIRFRNPDLGLAFKSTNGDNLIPELLLANSHNARASLRLFMALWRVVCSNGLVVPDTVIQSLKVRHMHYKTNEVITACSTLAGTIPQVIRVVDNYKSIILDELTRNEFAREAIKVRWPAGVTNLNPELLLRPSYPTDTKNDLWSIFNRIQYHVMNGGMIIPAEPGKKSTRLRRVTSIDKNIKINQKLWELAGTFQ